jgi:hypothetical protein
MDLLLSYNLLDKLIVDVKDEDVNLFAFAWAFTSMVKCVPLALTIPWQGSCFEHVLNKTHQYAYNDTNLFVLIFERICLIKIQWNGLGTLMKNMVNDKKHALMLDFPIKSWKQWKLSLLARWFYSKKPRNVKMSLIYVMGGKKLKNRKVVF